MNTNNGFEDLEIWKDGIRLTIFSYKILNKCKDYGFRDQIQRAVVSIPSNIAEGYERKTVKEFIQFLYIAKGSCGEYRTQLYIALKLEYISENDFRYSLETSKILSARISKFISYLKSKPTNKQT